MAQPEGRARSVLGSPDGAGSVKRLVLGFVGIHQGRERIAAITFGRAVLRARQALHVCQCSDVIRGAPNRFEVSRNASPESSLAR